jgi:hypothetical protein
MKLTNLDPKKYKRFFAFGCSFTNYLWPTWADIVGQDIPVYQNWAKPGAGNHYIFNSVMEAHARHQFNKNDLVIAMWSNKEREDRYHNNYWLTATNLSQEEVYGKKWFNEFGTDFKGYLVRDLAFIKATQTLLESSKCHWENFMINPITNIDIELATAAGLDKLSENEQYDYIVNAFNKLCEGTDIDPFIEHREVIEIYKDVFLKINKSLEGRWSNEYRINRISPNKDVHPTPLEALAFLDDVWPDNRLSDSSRNYANHWNNEMYKHNKILNPIHPINSVVRL